MDTDTDTEPSDDGITTCEVCGAQFLHTGLTACSECHAPFGTKPLAPGGDEVDYDLADWDDDRRAEVTMALVRDEIAHRWEGHELVVAQADGVRADEIVDRIDHPDSLAAEPDDGDLAADVLSSLYVSADVLQHEPGSGSSAEELMDALTRAPEASPYGVDASLWNEILGLARSVADHLAVDDDPDAVAAAAHALRELVWPLV
ncbi:MAG TPA: hypothetical protein VGH94_11990 [Acidimicrobiales bacterium]|jgi:hypothetical protein